MKKLLILTLTFAIFAGLKAPKNGRVSWGDQEAGTPLESGFCIAPVNSASMLARGAQNAYEARQCKYPELGVVDEHTGEFKTTTGPLAQQLLLEQTGQAAPYDQTLQSFDWQSINCDELFFYQGEQPSQSTRPSQFVADDWAAAKGTDALVTQTLQNKSQTLAQKAALINHECIAHEGFIEWLFDDDPTKPSAKVEYRPHEWGFEVKVYNIQDGREQLVNTRWLNHKELVVFLDELNLEFDPAYYPHDFSTGKIGKIVSPTRLSPPGISPEEPSAAGGFPEPASDISSLNDESPSGPGCGSARWRSYGPEPVFPLDEES